MSVCGNMRRQVFYYSLLYSGHSGYMKSFYTPSKKKKKKKLNNGHIIMLVQTWQIIEMAFKDEKCEIVCLQIQ